RALSLDIEVQEIDVGQISPDTVGEFDVVLFLGVFYHRYDAIDSLARAASVTKHLLIVETHLDLPDIERPAIVLCPPGHKTGNEETNWGGPNVSCMRELLLGHEFIEVEVLPHPIYSNRGIFHAWRSTEFRRAGIPTEPTAKPSRRRFTSRIINRIRPLLGHDPERR